MKLPDREKDIMHETNHFYVFRVKSNLFEVRKHSGTNSYLVGSGSNLESCIRTADKLNTYPQSV